MYICLEMFSVLEKISWKITAMAVTLATMRTAFCITLKNSLTIKMSWGTILNSRSSRLRYFGFGFEENKSYFGLSRNFSGFYSQKRRKKWLSSLYSDFVTFFLYLIDSALLKVQCKVQSFSSFKLNELFINADAFCIGFYKIQIIKRINFYKIQVCELKLSTLTALLINDF